MKIAIPVESDGMTIALRMGHAPSFAVYVVTGDQIIEEGLFPNEHAGHHHHDKAEGHHHLSGDDKDAVHEHRRQLGVIKECDAVLVRGVGPSMKAALLEEGVKIFRAKKSLGSEAMVLIQQFKDNSNSFIEER